MNIGVVSPRPLISVVIPTYNRAAQLPRALGSVYAQDGAGKLFDLEILVVDDGSKDETPHIIRRHRHVTYIRLKTNQGPSSARNAGILASRGVYIAFLDDDDEWLPHKLAVQVPILEERPEIGVVYGHGIVADDAGNCVTWPDTAPSGWVFEEFLTRPDDFVNIDTLLVRREAFDRIGLFDERVPTMEHYEMALRLARHYRWQFVPGHVTHGRYSTQGKWASDVLSGSNEPALRAIMENALSTLPDTPAYLEVRKKAAAALCATAAKQRWWANGLESVRDHLLCSLRDHPWLIDSPSVIEHLHRVVRELAQGSSAPAASVAEFWRQVTSAAGEPAIMGWIRKRRLLGRFLAEAALALQGCSPRQAGYLAVLSMMNDPVGIRWNLFTLFVNACLVTLSPGGRPFGSAYGISTGNRFTRTAFFAVLCAGLLGFGLFAIASDERPFPLETLTFHVKAAYASFIPESVREPIWIVRHWLVLLFSPLLDPFLYAMLGAIFLLERWIPARADERTVMGPLVQDGLWFIMHNFLNVVAIGACMAWLHLVYREHLSFLTIHAVEAWPLWAKITLAVLVADLLDWLHHFLRHKVWLFWCFHTVHHSQRRMNLFTDDRQHVVDALIANILVFLPNFMLAVDVSAAVYVVLVLKWYPKLYHANIKTNFGLLKYVLVTPQSHRIHHSREYRHRDKNFGVVFTVWDRMFGTLYPHYDEYPETGIDDTRFPLERNVRGFSLVANYLRQLAYPFALLHQRWRAQF